MSARKTKLPNVYLSYAATERHIAQKLAEELEAAGISTWSDTKIQAGSNWARQIAEALEQADVIVMLISPDWTASRWAQRELEYALRGTRFAGRVVPVMVRPTTKYPWILGEFQMIKLGRGKRGPHLSDVVQAVTSAASAA